MTTDRDQPSSDVLAYGSPKPEKPIPAWKHVVFAPLLVVLGLFIAAAIVGLLAMIFAAITQAS